MRTAAGTLLALGLTCFASGRSRAADFHLPYSPPCTERENVFAFTEKPSVKLVAKDRYEIAFAVKGYCDVTLGLIDEKGAVVRHLASGVLGSNAPKPFQKNSLKQKIVWHGKDDLGLYVKEPQKLRVRVSLGLKPTFDKLLGGRSPHNLPCRGLGLAADSTGVYVLMIGGSRKVYVRKFDFQGKYLQSLIPSPSNLPEKKLGGQGFVEYEPGKRAVHAPDVRQTVADAGLFVTGALGRYLSDIQPVVVNGKIFLCTDGRHAPSQLFYFYTDGSTDVEGMNRRPFTGRPHPRTRFAASPDGRWLYMTGEAPDKRTLEPIVIRCSTAGRDKPTVFLGQRGKPGSDNAHFNSPQGIACDAKGRVYVCDRGNNRVQVFSGEGKHLKTIPVDRPVLVCVHEKTGAIYVQHDARERGKSVRRLIRMESLENPTVTARVDSPAGIMVLDSWSAKPRLWVLGGVAYVRSYSTESRGNFNVTVWEESGKTFKKVFDFAQEAAAREGDLSPGYRRMWVNGGLGHKMVCNPSIGQVYVRNSLVFDLKTGKYLRPFRFRAAGRKLLGDVRYDDIAVDKRGYMHVHFNPGFYTPGVARVDPSQMRPGKAGRTAPLGSIETYPEVPYDYGVPKGGWLGVLPTKCQRGSKFFQDGIGVSMRGDVAVQSYIYYIPKMDDLATSISQDGRVKQRDTIGRGTYAGMVQALKAREKRGERIYSIKRRPGFPLAGGTIWVYDRSGELRRELSVNAGGLINGVQIDEDGELYFVNNRPKMVGEKSFLHGRVGIFGAAGRKDAAPFTGTLMKTRGGGLRVTLAGAPIKLDPLPDRTPDVLGGWIEDAGWLYAGASPIVPGGCSCPTQRSYLDWYKRMFVPEAYRHSIGVLDTAGNLIMHLGRYGNQDDAYAMKPGATDIPVTLPRFISGTDTYLCVADSGERIVVLRVAYHAKESVPIRRM